MSIVGGNTDRGRSHEGKSGGSAHRNCAFRVVDELECFDRVRMAEFLRLFQPEDLADLLKTVDNVICKELKTVCTAYNAGDKDSLIGSFHKIRGMAGNYGLETLAEISQSLETRLGSEDLSEIGEDLDRFMFHGKNACREIAYLMESL